MAKGCGGVKNSEVRKKLELVATNSVKAADRIDSILEKESFYLRGEDRGELARVAESLRAVVVGTGVQLRGDVVQVAAAKNWGRVAAFTGAWLLAPVWTGVAESVGDDVWQWVKESATSVVRLGEELDQIAPGPVRFVSTDGKVSLDSEEKRLTVASITGQVSIELVSEKHVAFLERLEREATLRASVRVELPNEASLHSGQGPHLRLVANDDDLLLPLFITETRHAYEELGVSTFDLYQVVKVASEDG